MIIMNRNTSPISPFKEEDYLKAYQLTQEQDYPLYEIERFKKIYAEINGWKAENLELANGSDEWIQKLMITYGNEGVLTLSPDFFMYQDYARQLDVDINFVPANQAYEFDLKQILGEIERLNPKLFILSNPQNPTSIQFTEEFLQQISDAMLAINGIFAIDEAYIEFGQDYQRPEGDHVIVLRTMSKIYGMAGLRIGILHATGDTYQTLTKINHPYPMNHLVVNLANTFLEDRNRLEEFIQYQLQSKEELIKAFAIIEDLVTIKETASNFVFTYGPNAIELGNHLLEEGFQARFYEEAGMEEVVRYSIIKLEDYTKLKQSIKQWRKQYDS